MVFLVTNDSAYPATFQQAIPPIYQESIWFKDDEIHCNEKAQQSPTLICCEWLVNIEDQQKL